MFHHTNQTPAPGALDFNAFPAASFLASLLFLAAASNALQGPCDIYQAAGTPCVAAHSTTRALYAAYSGPLYQVRRTSDNQTKDIGPIGSGGVADIATQDSFLNGKAGTISIIYDQSPQKNDLPKSPKCTYLSAGLEADASQGQIQLNGHTVHGIYITGAAANSWVPNGVANVAYRNNSPKGIAKGNQAESMYMVVDGKRYSDQCCFDYGNGETSGHDDGNGTMEALYWGTNITWGGKGNGTGPWVAADLENGMFKANQGGSGSSSESFPNDKTVSANFATTVLKGPAADTFGLKAGDAQSGKLVTMWNGLRPSPNYYPKQLEGAIFLGTGGDGSPGGTGTFFEGAMTMGNPPDSIDDKIQANHVAAGYGSTTTSILARAGERTGARLLYSPSTSLAVVEFDLATAGRTDLEIVDLQGKRVAWIGFGVLAQGPQRATWDASRVRTGIYVARLLQDGAVAWTGRVLVGR